MARSTEAGRCRARIDETTDRGKRVSLLRQMNGSLHGARVNQRRVKLLKFPNSAVG